MTKPAHIAGGELERLHDWCAAQNAAAARQGDSGQAVAYARVMLEIRRLQRQEGRSR